MSDDKERRRTMNPERQQRAIAEACGWKPRHHVRGYYRSVDEPWIEELPDYLNDLNAMHEAWSILGAEQRVEFEAHLYDIIVGLGEFHSSEDRPYITNATAGQRAEAFLKTIGKWEGEQP